MQDIHNRYTAAILRDISQMQDDKKRKMRKNKKKKVKKEKRIKGRGTLRKNIYLIGRRKRNVQKQKKTREEKDISRKGTKIND
ncbi:hypothetical protein QE152_g40656 [Popillia japonica]|uniref:Uncharacterized protein n=1 Tax=Popillia japonica TaxID=7064 RepID=A0AAW1HFK6_POPJA